MLYKFHRRKLVIMPQSLVQAIEARIPSRRELAMKLLQRHALTSVQDVTVANILSGMRGLQCVLWEISETDEKGVRYHGMPLADLEEILPRWRGSEIIAAEAVLWFLYTARVPTREEVEDFASDLAHRAELPEYVARYCDALPSDCPVLEQVMMAVTALSRHSKFADAIQQRMPKTELWKYTLEDALDATARLPMVIARIHSNRYHHGRYNDAPLDPTAHFARNFALRMGKAADPVLPDSLPFIWRMSFDHGCNLSAHSMRLCSSALSDAYSTMVSGFAVAKGPLHMAALEEATKFSLDMYKTLGADATYKEVEDYICAQLAKGNFIYGYGHALLRVRDPRLDIMLQYTKAQKVPGSEGEGMFRLLYKTIEWVPQILTKHLPKMKSPWPNVDVMTGTVLHAANVEDDFHMVIIASGRMMGFMSQMVWDRALGLPIERPTSITIDELSEKLKGKVGWKTGSQRVLMNVRVYIKLMTYSLTGVFWPFKLFLGWK